MKVRNLRLTDYRNYQHLDIEFNPEKNIIIGDNAQGKTNLIESLYLLSTCRSFRINNNEKLIRENAAFSIIESDIEAGILKKLRMVIMDKGKSLFISNQQINKTSDFIGIINAVLFSPDDIILFSAAKGMRRKLMNLEIGKISRKYMDSLNYYQKLLKDRNALLKKNEVDFFLIESIDEKMIEKEIDVIRFRKHFIDYINSRINRFYHYLSATEDKIRIDYDCCITDFADIRDSLEQMYRRNRDKDKLYRMTQNGIHREDIIFYINENKVSEFASQGQRRMIMLAFKFAVIEYIQNSIKDYPVLLLDDVLSELDINVRKRLFRIIDSKLQVFITTTDISEINIEGNYKIIEIKNGKVLKGSK